MNEEAACPTCGRAPNYWSDREPGAKQRQRADEEDRDAGYRSWHRRLGAELLAMDVDQVEYRIDGEGQPRLRAILELTRIDGAPDPPPSYFASILTRAGKRDAQVQILRLVAESCGVPIYYVAYMKDRSRFYVADVRNSHPHWRNFSAAEYRAFLAAL